MEVHVIALLFMPFFMQDACMAVYTKEKIAKSRTPALELLIKVSV